jgi:hypothetical protein
MTVREEITEKLSAFRQKMQGSFGQDDRRLALLQLIRCLDHEGASPSLYGQAHDAHKINCELFGWGLNEALLLFWNDEVKEAGVPLTRTTSEYKQWADSVLVCSGKVRLIEYALELERIGLGTLSRSSTQQSSYDFRYSHLAIGVEAIEREDAQILKILARREDDQSTQAQNLAERRASVTEKMRELVKPFHDHYISYGAAPEVDQFYDDLSKTIALSLTGWDAFPPNCIFGGISYFKYVECVRHVIGFAMKHLDFCLLLCEAHPKINPIDILSVPSKWTDTFGFMACALGIHENESEQIMLTTCLTPENAKHHLAIPAGPIAPHYMIGDGSVVRSIIGCTHNPFHFMLRELKRKHPLDWDKSVDQREHAFRDDLIRLFSGFGRIVFFTDNIDINSSSGKTDIDVFAYDPHNKIAGIFQLKWQDAFGGSMRERESRKRNFLQGGNAWVEKVISWHEEGRMPGVLASLGMPSEMAKEIESIRVFVLGRTFSHFSGEYPIDSRAAWGNWFQVLRLFDKKVDSASPITSLYELLIADSPVHRTSKPFQLQGIKVAGLTIVMHPHEPAIS